MAGNTAPDDPIRSAAEQLARDLPLTGEPSPGVIGVIETFARQQRAEAEQERDVILAKGADEGFWRTAAGRELELRKRAESEVSRLRAALEAAQQFLSPEIPRGPGVYGWANTVEAVKNALGEG